MQLGVSDGVLRRKLKKGVGNEVLVTGSGICSLLCWLHVLGAWRNGVMEDLDCRSGSCAGGGEGTADKNFKEEGRVEFIYSLITWCTTYLLEAGWRKCCGVSVLLKKGGEKKTLKAEGAPQCGDPDYSKRCLQDQMGELLTVTSPLELHPQVMFVGLVTSSIKSMKLQELFQQLELLFCFEEN